MTKSFVCQTSPQQAVPQNTEDSAALSSLLQLVPLLGRHHTFPAKFIYESSFLRRFVEDELSEVMGLEALKICLGIGVDLSANTVFRYGWPESTLRIQRPFHLHPGPFTWMWCDAYDHFTSLNFEEVVLKTSPLLFC